jgi:hypothetical protein
LKRSLARGRSHGEVVREYDVIAVASLVVGIAAVVSLALSI